MAANLAAKPLFDLRYVRDVIEMTVGQQEQFRHRPARFQPLAGAIRGIEENQARRRFKEVAVGLVNTAAESLVFDPYPCP